MLDGAIEAQTSRGQLPFRSPHDRAQMDHPEKLVSMGTKRSAVRPHVLMQRMKVDAAPHLCLRQAALHDRVQRHVALSPRGGVVAPHLFCRCRSCYWQKERGLPRIGKGEHQGVVR